MRSHDEPVRYDFPDMTLLSTPVNGDPADPAYSPGSFDRSRVRLMENGDFGIVSEGHCPFCLGRLDVGLCRHCGERFVLRSRS